MHLRLCGGEEFSRFGGVAYQAVQWVGDFANGKNQPKHRAGARRKLPLLEPAQVQSTPVMKLKRLIANPKTGKELAKARRHYARETPMDTKILK